MHFPLSFHKPAAECVPLNRDLRLTMFVALGIDLQPLHKVLEILLLLRAVLQTPLLQLRVVFEKELFLARRDPIYKCRTSDDHCSATGMPLVSGNIISRGSFKGGL